MASTTTCPHGHFHPRASTPLDGGQGTDRCTSPHAGGLWHRPRGFACTYTWSATASPEAHMETNTVFNQCSDGKCPHFLSWCWRTLRQTGICQRTICATQTQFPWTSRVSHWLWIVVPARCTTTSRRRRPRQLWHRNLGQSSTTLLPSGQAMVLFGQKRFCCGLSWSSALAGPCSQWHHWPMAPCGPCTPQWWRSWCTWILVEVAFQYNPTPRSQSQPHRHDWCQRGYWTLRWSTYFWQWRQEHAQYGILQGLSRWSLPMCSFYIAVAPRLTLHMDLPHWWESTSHRLCPDSLRLATTLYALRRLDESGLWASGRPPSHGNSTWLARIGNCASQEVSWCTTWSHTDRQHWHESSLKAIPTSSMAYWYWTSSWRCQLSYLDHLAGTLPDKCNRTKEELYHRGHLGNAHH